jgi:conjugative relaxase-like TrwC/TraI family protein
MQVSRSDTCEGSERPRRQQPKPASCWRQHAGPRQVLPASAVPGGQGVQVSTRALGAGDGNARRAAGQVVEYLESGVTAKQGRRPGQTLEPSTGGNADGLDGYYADSSETAGEWLGRGFASVQVAGAVHRESFTRILLGQHPGTGEQLVSAVGSAGRAELAGRAGLLPEDREWLSVAEAADVLNVRSSYVRRLLERGGPALSQAGAGDGGVLPTAHLLGNKDDQGHWRVARAEVERFAEARRKPSVVVGYDVTFSVPKSVSVLWAALDAPQRSEIVASVDAAVAAGVAYLEDHAAFVRVNGRRVRSEGIVAASYLHGTSRALEPQLHRHVVIANMAAAPGGRVQTLDGTQIHLHQRTAAALAGAELRRQLTERLGVRWGPVVRGKSDIVGVPAAAMRAMSTRSAEIAELVAELGHDSAAARQVAAYQTRAAKQPVPAAELRAGWQQRLAAAGLARSAAHACIGVVDGPRPVSAPERAGLHALLQSLVTEETACFDRRDVIQAVAGWGCDRLSATEVGDLADEWLASEAVVRVDGRRSPWSGTRDSIRRNDGRRVGASTGSPIYTTVEMLQLEQRVRSAVIQGRSAGAGWVPSDVLDTILGDHTTLGADQEQLVRALTSSGHRVQLAVGPAGTGKTFALATAAQAWRAAGYRTLGVAVGGTAAEVLGQATGMPATTVASLLTRLDLAHPTEAVLDERAVVVVDEASTLGNRELDRLIGHVGRAGATLRLVGDPAQHGAVPAGGLWRVLVDEHPEDTPRLTELRRQRGADMEPVRGALEDYREGKVHIALQRLDADGRVVEGDDAEEILDRLVADWYGDRQHRRDHPTEPASSMVAEHHVERRELNRRARLLLAGDGTLHGPALTVEGVEFSAGDEVIARTQSRELRPAGGDRHSFVRNGTRGVVRQVLDPQSATPSLLVDFDGRGLIEVPWRYLSGEVSPGQRGGLAHSYALTSYASQGETYMAARHLATERSSRAGVYVGLSRGTTDARLYVARQAGLDPDLRPEHGLPAPEPTGNPLDALAQRLRHDGVDRLATELDPDIVAVTQLAQSHTLTELLARVDHDPLAARAADAKAANIAGRACAAPPAALVAKLGPRPDRLPARQRWDRAVGAVAVYREIAPGPLDDLGEIPGDPVAARLHDRAVAALDAAAPVAVRPPAPRPPAVGLELG